MCKAIEDMLIESKKEIAKKMLQNGKLFLEEVAECYGLTLEEVRELEEGKTQERKAYEELQQFRKCSNVEMDYKAELAQAKEKKYF